MTYTREAIAAALKRLEDEHCYGFPEFWDYIEEADRALADNHTYQDNES